MHHSISSKIRLVTQTAETICIQFVGDQIKLNLVFTYLSPSCLIPLESVFQNLNPFNEVCLIFGDFNARIGNYQNTSTDRDRKSKDKSVNSRGKYLISYLNNNNLIVLNGATESDSTGNFTFSNKNGCSVIDLCIVSENIHKYLDFTVLESEGSSHFPILASINEIKLSTNVYTYEKLVWNNDKIEHFRDNLDNLLTYYPNEKFNLKDYIQVMNQAAADSGMVKVIKSGAKSFSFGPAWFDSKCVYEKKMLLKKLRLFRKDNCNERLISYINARRSYCNLIKAKKIRFFSNLDTKLSSSRNPHEFYKALSYYRPKRINQLSQEPINLAILSSLV